MSLTTCILPTLSEAEVALHVANIARDGFSIMPDAIPPNFRAEICDELDRLERVRPGGDIPPQPFTGEGNALQWCAQVLVDVDGQRA